MVRHRNLPTQNWKKHSVFYIPEFLAPWFFCPSLFYKRYEIFCFALSIYESMGDAVVRAFASHQWGSLGSNPGVTPYVRRRSKRPLKFFPVWFFSLVGYSFVAAWPRWSSLLSQRTYKRSTCSKSNMWVEFVVGSLLSSERFFSRVLRFSPLLKNQYFQIPVRLRFNEFIKTLKCFVGKQITKKELIFSTI